MKKIVLSRLAHTWLIDIDGTLFKHNSHKSGADELLPGVKEFWNSIPKDDIIVLLTARGEFDQVNTEEALSIHGLRFDHILFSLPTGERILINDTKPSGLTTSVALNISRDEGLSNLHIEIDNNL